MVNGDEGTELQLESLSSSDKSRTPESKDTVSFAPEPDHLAAARVIDAVSHAVSKLEAAAWVRTLPGHEPRNPLLEELAWVLRACVLAADRKDIDWLAGQKGRAYLERYRDWRRTHYRAEAGVPYRRPQAAFYLRQWVAWQLNRALEEFPDGPTSEDFPAIAERLSNFVLSCIFEDPEILVSLQADLGKKNAGTSEREDATRRVTEVFMRERVEGRDPLDAAEAMIRAVLRSLDYDATKVRSFFDALPD